MADDDEHLAYGDLPEPSASSGNAPNKAKSGLDSLLNTFHGIASGLRQKSSHVSSHIPGSAPKHRFDSFAGPQEGNDVKWYVDGCGYFWAVSVALEQAKESIWILDWWLSPELYLRRPPAKNEKYRLDRMLQAAAERGVKVRIIVYK